MTECSKQLPSQVVWGPSAGSDTSAVSPRRMELCAGTGATGHLVILRDALFKRTLDFFQTGGGPPPSVWTSSGQYFLKAISPIKNNHNYGPKVPKIWWYTFNWVKNDKFCTSGSQILFLKRNSKCLKILPQNFRIGGRAPPPLWVKVQSKPAFFFKKERP